MNTTSYMDKQIMDLSHQQSKDFIDLMNHSPNEDQSPGDGINKEEIVPSYDFQPIRPLGPSSSSQSPKFDSNLNLSRAWNSVDSSESLNTSTATPIRNYTSLDSIEPAKVIPEKERKAVDATILAEIDQTMSKHMDNLLHVLDSVGARLTQLESRSRQLDNSVDDLRVSVGNNHGSTEGRMRQLENILREVQSGVELLKDKQEIMDAKLQLAKLQISNVDQQAESQNSLHVDPVQQTASAPQPSPQQLPPSINPPQPTSLSPPNAPPQPPSHHNLPPQVQHPAQFPPNQIPPVLHREPYFPPPSQTQEPPTPQYQLPPTQQPHPSPAPPPPPLHQQYQPPSQHLQYSQPPPQVPQQHPNLSPINPTQLQPMSGPHAEETPYIPPQNYQPTLRQPPSQPPSRPAPTQQFYGAPSHMSSGFSPAYGPPSGPTEPYNYGGSPSHFGNNHSSIKPATSQSGAGSYPQLPSGRVLPHALPTASGVSGGGGGGSGSSGSGNRIPHDDVIDKVMSMGFPREHVRATVRRLTESGQAVDLNVVLDKLMNEGDVQPPRGWLGR